MLDQLTALLPWAHAGSTWFMVGLIWFVQIVHYPLMGSVPPEASPAYAGAHQRRTTWVVGPVMLLEAGTAMLLVLTPHTEAIGLPWAWIGLALLALCWASTFMVQVPLHARLALGFDPNSWRRLVATNWLRTIAWSGRGIIALVMLNSWHVPDAR
ncbi:MAG: hypothetical protein AMXMBFR58_15790 [Phycisphaerae bacterium]|nr:hypothetical protein [Phycisphaerales bacterium]MCK6476103.1 hypothetical protein [Phycisphaerales bacterium]